MLKNIKTCIVTSGQSLGLFSEMLNLFLEVFTEKKKSSIFIWTDLFQKKNILIVATCNVLKNTTTLRFFGTSTMLFYVTELVFQIEVFSSFW